LEWAIYTKVIILLDNGCYMMREKYTKIIMKITTYKLFLPSKDSVQARASIHKIYILTC
jgi:hypothetical protein